MRNRGITRGGGWVGEGEDSTAPEDITGALVTRINGLPTPRDRTTTRVILMIRNYRPHISDHMDLEDQDPGIQVQDLKARMGGSIHHDHHHLGRRCHTGPRHQAPKDSHPQDSLEHPHGVLLHHHGHGSPRHSPPQTHHRISHQDRVQTPGMSSYTAASIHSTTPPPVITWGRIQAEGERAETAGTEEGATGDVEEVEEETGDVEEVEDMEGIWTGILFRTLHESRFGMTNLTRIAQWEDLGSVQTENLSASDAKLNTYSWRYLKVAQCLSRGQCSEDVHQCIYFGIGGNLYNSGSVNAERMTNTNFLSLQSRKKQKKDPTPNKNKSFYCETCDRGYQEYEKYREHCDQHIEVSIRATILIEVSINTTILFIINT